MVSEEINSLLAELKNLSLNCSEPIDSEYRSVFFGGNRLRVRQIGHKLHELGGYNLMLSVWREIPRHDQLELTAAWDGIGIWKV